MSFTKTKMLFFAVILLGCKTLRSYPEHDGISLQEQFSLEKILPFRTSSVLINCFDGESKLLWSGSGIKISDDQVLTARHIWGEGKESATVCGIYTKKYSSPIAASIFGMDSRLGRDITVMTVQSNSSVFSSLPSAKLALDQTFSDGQRLFMISHPDGWFDPEVTIGHVANVESSLQNGFLTPPSVNWSGAIDVDITGTAGSSGAPVFNSSGEVVGIYVGYVPFNKDSGPLNISMILPLEKADNIYNVHGS